MKDKNTQNNNTINKTQGDPIANVHIKGLDQDTISFVSGEYTEVLNGVLPRLVVKYISDADKIPTDLTDVDVVIKIRNSEWEVKANVDDIRFELNTVTFFMTLAPKEFYYVTHSTKFTSIEEAVTSMYYNSVDSSKLDNDNIEYNQIGTTDYWYCNLLLASLSAPKAFAYTMNELVIADLGSTQEDKVIDPEKVTYSIDEQQKKYILQDLLVSQPLYAQTDVRNQNPSSEILEWGGYKININIANNDNLRNLVDNSKFVKDLKLSVRLNSQMDLDLKCGEKVKINLPNLESDLWLVDDRLVVIGSEIKFSYRLKALN